MIQAPEMVKGEVVGPPADIWTVGVVTHIMQVNRPFEINLTCFYLIFSFCYRMLKHPTV